MDIFWKKWINEKVVERDGLLHKRCRIKEDVPEVEKQEKIEPGWVISYWINKQE